MHAERPQLRRCCFCLPLRRGLIGWGYIRIAFDILVASIFATLMIFANPRDIELEDKKIILITWAVCLFLDAAFSLLLVVAGHLKNAKLLRISFTCCIVSLTLKTAFIAYNYIFYIFRIYMMWQYFSHPQVIMELILSMAGCFAEIIIDVYIILLIRSEEAKLKSQSLEMEFVNNAAESEARCVGAAQRYTETDDSAPNTAHERDTAQYTAGEHDSQQFTSNGTNISPYTDNEDNIRQYAFDGHDINLHNTINEQQIV